MRISEHDGEIHISAEDGKCLMHKHDYTPFYEVWLAKDDVIDNWIEVDDIIVEMEEK